jgi:tetratricopeptide (TPR) repeat protein
VSAILAEIANGVATSLRGDALSAPEQQALARPQTGALAYEYYLRGRQGLPRMAAGDLRKGAEMFDRAIALDADYAPAHTGLAMVHATLHEWFGARDEDRSRAERASERALELAPESAETHVARACALSLSRRYDEADQEFEQAIRLDPNLFDAYYCYARTAFAQGEIERSADLFKKAADVRQDDFQSPMLLAQSLEMLGRAEEAAMANREGNPPGRADPGAEPDPRPGAVTGIERAALGWPAGACPGVVEPIAGAESHRSEHADERRVPAGQAGSQGSGARFAGTRLRTRVWQARLGGARSGL